MPLSRAATETALDIAQGLLWRWSCCHPTPLELPQPGGSYTPTYGVRWVTLEAGPLRVSPQAAAYFGAAEVGARQGDRSAAAVDRSAAAVEETLAKAPPWLFSAESDLSPPPWRILAGGVRVDSRGWGASPPPWVLSHFVCSAWPGSAGREQAMRAWGHWRARAIGRDLPEHARKWREARTHMVGLAQPVSLATQGSLEEHTAAAYEWARLVIALASATGRTPVLPALRCVEQMMRSRCVWQIRGVRQDSAVAGHARGRSPVAVGTTCLLRWPNGCNDAMLLPNEAREAAARESTGRGHSIQRIAPSNASELVAMLRPDVRARDEEKKAAAQRKRAAGDEAAHERHERERARSSAKAYVAAQRSRHETTTSRPPPQEPLPPSARPLLLLLDVGVARAYLKEMENVKHWASSVTEAFNGGTVAWQACSLSNPKKAPRCQAVC